MLTHMSTNNKFVWFTLIPRFIRKHLKKNWDSAIFVFLSLTFMLLPTGTALPLISVSIAGALWIFSGGLTSIPGIAKTVWFRPAALFLVLPWLGLIYSQDLDLGIDYAMKTKYWLLLFVTAGCCLDETRVFVIVKALWIGLFAGALLAAAQVVGLVGFIRPDFPGFGIVYTLVGMYLNIGILMAAFYFKQIENPWGKLALLVLIAGFLFHLVVLKGRSSYLIFLLVSPLVAKDLLDKFSWMLKALLCSLLIASLCLTPSFKNRIKETCNMIKDNKDKIVKGEFIPVMPRFYFVRESLAAMKKSPVWGIGTGSLTEFTRYSGSIIVHHPHNDFLYMGASYGIIGIIACFWLFWNMFKISWKARNTPLGYFVFSTCLVMFIGGLFDTQILNTGTLVMIAMTYGFLHQLTLKLPEEQDMND